jgi:hypothetical protein
VTQTKQPPANPGRFTGIKGDRTYRLLARSIRDVSGEAWKVEYYNDDAENYGEVHFLILWALALSEVALTRSESQRLRDPLRSDAGDGGFSARRA